MFILSITTCCVLRRHRKTRINVDSTKNILLQLVDQNSCCFCYCEWRFVSEKFTFHVSNCFWWIPLWIVFIMKCCKHIQRKDIVWNLIFHQKLVSEKLFRHIKTNKNLWIDNAEDTTHKNYKMRNLNLKQKQGTMSDSRSLLFAYILWRTYYIQSFLYTSYLYK